MRYFLVFLSILVISCHSNTYAQSLKILPNTFFKSGEVLTFQLRYGFIVGGNVTLTVEEKNNLYHLKGLAKTTGLAEKLFSVKDTYESFIEIPTGLPVFAIQNVKEGKTYKYYNEVKFNRTSNTVVSSLSGEHTVPAGILDMISVFYYIRRMDFTNAKNGDSYKVDTYFSDKLFPFELRFRGREVVSTPKGEIACLKFAPIVEPGRVFKSKDDMYIWYTDDENRIPVLISMEMLVGHVYCELIDYKEVTVTPRFKNSFYKYHLILLG